MTEIQIDTISRIMMNFDFEKVLVYMERVDQKWSMGNEYEVPTIFELREI